MRGSRHKLQNELGSFGSSSEFPEAIRDFTGPCGSTIMIPEGMWVVELEATNGPGLAELSGMHEIH
jgi:hypothetical protein